MPMGIVQNTLIVNRNSKWYNNINYYTIISFTNNY